MKKHLRIRHEEIDRRSFPSITPLGTFKKHLIKEQNMNKDKLNKHPNIPIEVSTKTALGFKEKMKLIEEGKELLSLSCDLNDKVKIAVSSSKKIDTTIFNNLLAQKSTKINNALAKNESIWRIDIDSQMKLLEISSIETKEILALNPALSKTVLTKLVALHKDYKKGLHLRKNKFLYST